MSDESKIRRDKDTGYPKYDKFEDHGKIILINGVDILEVKADIMKEGMEKISVRIQKKKQEKVLKNKEEISDYDF